MSEHNPQHGHDPHGHGDEQVESSALAPKPILLFLVILFVATAFVFVIVRGLDFGLKKLDESNQGQVATEVETRGRQLPPSPMPLLQGAPGKDDKPTALPLEDMEKVRKAADQQLSSYGWVDKPGGIVRIPLNRAKDNIAEKGLPALPSPTISEELQKAETVRKEVLEAGSSAGRMIKIPGQNQQPIPVQKQQTIPGQNQQPIQQPVQPQDQKPPQNQQRVPPQQH
jgi:hypothetical protein